MFIILNNSFTLFAPVSWWTRKTVMYAATSKGLLYGISRAGLRLLCALWAVEACQYKYDYNVVHTECF